MFFDVPQSRERMIFIGVRNDIAVEPTFPRGSTQTVSMSAAIGDLPDDGPVATASRGEALARMPIGARNNGGRYLSHSFGVCRPDPNRPAPCLTKQEHRIAHPNGKRWLSIAAAKRLGSFPDEMKLIGTYSEQWQRIGNSVPPLLMRAVSGHVRTSLL